MADLTDADLDYLRNINTRPGPGVGQSIDPTKPGQTADRIAELEQGIAQLENQEAPLTPLGLSVLEARRAELSRLCNPELNERGEPMDAATIARGRKPTDAENAPLSNEQQLAILQTKPSEAELNKPRFFATDLQTLAKRAALSPATSPGPQDVREKIVSLAMRALERRRFADKDGRYLLTQSQAFDAFVEVLDSFPALAQSDAQQELSDISAAIGSPRFMDPPDGGSVSLAEQVRRMRQALEAVEKQSDAQPVGTDHHQHDVVCSNCGWRGARARFFDKPCPRCKVGRVILYTAPHSPDASGLIEAAEELSNFAWTAG